MNTTMESSGQFLLNNVKHTQDDLQKEVLLADLFAHHDRVPIQCFDHLAKYKTSKGQNIGKTAIENTRETLKKLLKLEQEHIHLSPMKDLWKEQLEKIDAISEKPVDIQQAQFTIHIEGMLQHLEYDLELLEQEEDWNWLILAEALKLVTFLHHVFAEDLKEIHNPPLPPEKRTVWSEMLGLRVKNRLDSLREKKESLERKFTNRNKNDMQKFKLVTGDTTWDTIKIEGKVTSASLVELLVRNAVRRCQKEILEKLQNKTRADAQRGGKEMAESILKPALAAVFVPKSPRPKIDAAWVSRTIAIVIDTKSGLAVTGSTQAVCDRFKLFKEAGTRIHRHRLGSGASRFVISLDMRSESYSALITPMTKFLKYSGYSVYPSLYNDFFVEKKLSADTQEKLRALQGESCVPSHSEQFTTPQQADTSEADSKLSWETVEPEKTISKLNNPVLAASRGDSHILCWAIAGESQLKFVPPCLRCQSLHDTWIMWGAPEDDFDKYDLCRKGMTEPSSTCDYKAGTSFCCAESVAAAKIYALRHAKLVLC